MSQEGASLSNSQVKVVHLPEIDSTSAYLKRLIADGSLLDNTLCITDKQTSGYGQRSRSWLHGPDNLAFSYAVQLKRPITGRISAQVALLLHKYLSLHSSDTLYLKWPNDLFNGKGKVAGILLEVANDRSTHQPYLVIGIGINLATAPDCGATEYPVGRIHQLKVDPFLSEFSQALFDFFFDGDSQPQFSNEEWSLYDYFHPNQAVIVYDTDQNVEARYIGVNSDAEVVLQIGRDKVAYQTSRVSIRPKKDEWISFIWIFLLN